MSIKDFIENNAQENKIQIKFESISVQSGKDYTVESLNDSLKKLVLIDSDNVPRNNYKNGMASYLRMLETDTSCEKIIKSNREKLTNVNLMKHKVKYYYVDKLFAGGVLLVYDNKFAEFIVFGSGRPVISYVAGFVV